MEREPVFAWEGHEYAFEEKSADWYWALGIIAIAAIVASVVFKNILLAFVIAAAAIAVALHAAKRPRVHRFAITEEGLHVDQFMYPYSMMLHFSVLEYADTNMPPSLSVKTRNPLSPHLLIPIVGHDPLAVYEYLLNHLKEGQHELSVIDRIVDMIRI